MQRKTKLVAGGAVAILALGAAVGLASASMDDGWRVGHGWGVGHGPGMMGQRMMERYDADKDGKLTQQEIDQNRTQWHAEFDGDKNSALSLEEFKALWMKARGEMMVREFQFLDRDGNAQVTLEEYTAPMRGIVSARDRNGDGVLSADDRRGHGGGRVEGYRWRKHGGMGGGMATDGHTCGGDEDGAGSPGDL